MNYHLEGLSKAEAKEYVLEKLKSAGCHANIFAEGALEAIVNASNGIARIINKICDKCLLICHVSEETSITSETVMQAVNETVIG